MKFPVPSEVHELHAGFYLGLLRLRESGLNPDFLLDVGASSGCFSFVAALVYPKLRYVLVEPLASLYREQKERYCWLGDLHPEFEFVEVAVSDKRGKVKINVATELCSSSLYPLAAADTAKTMEVEALTLDDIDAQKGLQGRGILKLDIQFAEHLALRGAKRLIRKIDVILMEVAVERLYKDTMVLSEVVRHMDKAGFRYHDDLGEYRRPENDMLCTKDVLFLRKGLLAS
jgi:FkbM family methyltransferase